VSDFDHEEYLIAVWLKYQQEEFEDTKGVIRICISKKNRQHDGQKKKNTKGQTMNYKTLHIKVKIE